MRGSSGTAPGLQRCGFPGAPLPVQVSRRWPCPRGLADVPCSLPCPSPGGARCPRALRGAGGAGGGVQRRGKGPGGAARGLAGLRAELGVWGCLAVPCPAAGRRGRGRWHQGALVWRRRVRLSAGLTRGGSAPLGWRAPPLALPRPAGHTCCLLPRRPQGCSPTSRFEAPWKARGAPCRNVLGKPQLPVPPLQRGAASLLQEGTPFVPRLRWPEQPCRLPRASATSRAAARPRVILFYFLLYVLFMAIYDFPCSYILLVPGGAGDTTHHRSPVRSEPPRPRASDAVGLSPCADCPETFAQNR